MSGKHADRGDLSHRITSGEAPTLGLRVIDYDHNWGTITAVADRGDCGWYCNAWHTVTLDNGGTSSMNCERLTTRFGGMVDPAPAPKPCERCGWQYPAEHIVGSARSVRAGQGAWKFDENPTHACRS